jgi:hypothetical protein
MAVFSNACIVNTIDNPIWIQIAIALRAGQWAMGNSLLVKGLKLL